jgi:NNP family nitrate/nitrite transporter-like MFS transporter
VSCLVITYAVYTRKGGLLHDVEHRSRPDITIHRAAAE